MLESVKAFIFSAQILTQPYKDQKDTYILDPNEDLIKELDDNLVMISNI